MKRSICLLFGWAVFNISWIGVAETVAEEEHNTTNTTEVVQHEGDGATDNTDPKNQDSENAETAEQTNITSFPSTNTVENAPPMELGQDGGAAEAEKSELDLLREEMEKLRIQREQFNLEQGIAHDQFQAQLTEMRREQEKLSLEMELKQTRLNKELFERRQKLERLRLEAEELQQKLSREDTERQLKLKKELDDLREENERLQLKNQLANSKMQELNQSAQKQDVEIGMEQKMMQFEIAKMQHVLSLQEQKDELNNRVSREKIIYTTEPFQDGVLTLSDRRISLNGVITYETADYITERIHYFNNQSKEYPIFIVIDASPGGSVMSGYRILKAMEGSEAPVHVVVKSFAASMAATICTLAEQSYAYPNAIILHHQLLYGMWGNLTHHSEMLEEAAEWYRRLAEPVADKMGVSLDEFVKQMYENNSDGDWREFADQARELKWVDHIVTELRESGEIINPDSKPDTDKRPMWARAEKTDEKGQPYVIMPRLIPFDAYYMYDPQDYYRNWWE